MLYPLVSQFFLQHLGSMPLLWLGQSALSVSRVLATPESGEPWAGFARFEDLVASASEVETAWTVHFATPTTFKAGEAELPLPIPRLCFQSWLNSWDEHAPCPFFPDRASRKAFLSEVVEGNVSVTYPRLQLVQHTFYFDGTRTREQGFVGTCRFAVRPTRVAPQYRRLLATLARYSYYAGTGRKTTMGMGMTRYMQKDHPGCLTP
jgi:CRISPR-associated endoribonuclease Cas6